jgi:glycosyltransferase involved in cell wall biosynthesis
VAARRITPFFYTLHYLWRQCRRFALRVPAVGGICHTIAFARCGRCLARFKYAQTPLERRAAGVIAGLKGATGLDLSGAARALAARKGAGGGPEPDAAAERAMADAASERDRALRERLVPRVERFLAPSRFLRERFLEWGIPPERIEHLDYGLERGPFEGFRRTPSERVRVAFLGTLAPHKAPHLVLEAWRALPEDLRARGQLEVFGPKQHNPAYVARLEALARAAGARLPGGVPREDVPALFRRIDLLVVPSVWYENQPLSILEALASRTPLVVSELGGMAELVTPEVHGWRFAPGDASDLARVLARVLADPGLLTRLPYSAPPKDMATSAAELEERYRAALARAEERAT